MTGLGRCFHSKADKTLVKVPMLSRHQADIRAMLRIAIPLALAALGWMFMSVVDTVMVGGLPSSAVAIGAASVGSALFYAFSIFGTGLMAGSGTRGRCGSVGREA